MKTKRERRNTLGHTLVETLAAVAVAGVLGAVAVPTFASLVRDTRRTDVVNDLVASFLLARAQAASRGQPVVVCGYHDANGNGSLDDAEVHCAGHDWSEGWFAASWVDGDGDNVIDRGELAVLRANANAHGATVHVRALAFASAPQPPGAAVVRPFPARSSNGTLTVCDTHDVTARAIVLSASGRTRLAERKSDGSAHAC
jgi:type IV fimbrial biogenesis protein FimT